MKGDKRRGGKVVRRERLHSQFEKDMKMKMKDDF